LHLETIAVVWIPGGYPPGVKSEQGIRRYQNQARAILLQSEELRQLIDSVNLQDVRDEVRRLAGLSPGYDLERYADGLRKRYLHLRLESLDTGGLEHPSVQLPRVFIEQHVLDCQRFNPRAYDCLRITNAACGSAESWTKLKRRK
jgi:hypothetical protein